MGNNSLRIGSTLVAVLGVLLFSTKAIFAKLMYQEGAIAIEALSLRMLFSLPVYLAMLARTSSQPAISTKNYLWLLGFGLIGYYLASFFDFKGLEYIKASLERLILFVYPTLVILMSYLIFKERLTRAQTLGLVATYLGILIVFFPEVQVQNSSDVLTGALLVFLSALTYGSYIVGSGWLIPKIGTIRFTSIAMMISAIAVIIHYFISVDTIRLLEFDRDVYIYGLCMAVFSTILPSYLISYAIRGLGANQFSIFGSLGPISTILLAYLFLGERLTWLQIVGGVIVIGGVFIAERYKVKVSRT